MAVAAGGTWSPQDALALWQTEICTRVGFLSSMLPVWMTLLKLLLNFLFLLLDLTSPENHHPHHGVWSGG